MNANDLAKQMESWDVSRWNREFQSYSTWYLVKFSVSKIEMFDEDDGKVAVSGLIYDETYHQKLQCKVTFSDSPTGLTYTVVCGCGASRCIHCYKLIIGAKEECAFGAVPASLARWASEFTDTKGLVPARKRQLKVGLILRLQSMQDPLSRSMPVRTFFIDAPEVAGKRGLKVDRDDPFVLSELTPSELAKLGVLEVSITREPNPAYRPVMDFTIDTEAQEAVFAQLLAEGCVFRDRYVGKPLAMGPPITPTVEWLTQADGYQSLGLVTADGSLIEQGVQLKSLWYLQGSVMGPLRGNAFLLKKALRAPGFRADQRAAVEALWDAKLKAAGIPKPPKPSMVKDITTSPTGVLTLRIVKPGALGTTLALPDSFPVADLGFDYDGWLVPYSGFDNNDIAIRKKGNQVARIHRDSHVQIRTATSVRAAGIQFGADHALAKVLFTREADTLVNVKGLADLDDMLHFMSSIDLCEAAGMRVIRSGDFPSLEVDDAIGYHTITAEDGPGGGWFGMEFGVEIEGERHNLGDIVAAALAHKRFPLQPTKNEAKGARWSVQTEDGRVVRLPLQTLRKLVTPVLEWLDTGSPLRKGRIRLSRLQAAMAAEDTGAQAPRSLADVRSAIMALKDLANAPLPQTPEDFEGTLRPYQLEGLRWLDALAAAGMGGILGDDMGLGKTPQVIAHILSQRERRALQHPVLVVVTKSLTGNWVKEIAKFAPGLRVLLLHGAGRSKFMGTVSDYDVVISTYNLLPKDIPTLETKRFSLVVLDESQNVKNTSALAAKALRRLAAPRTIALTGTPLENRLLELWAQMDLAVPGLLGERTSFQRVFATPIEKHNDLDRSDRMQRRIRLFLLRRTKEQVAIDLPEKTSIVRFIELDTEQRALYESMRVAMHAKVQAAIAEHGLAKSGIVVLEAMLRLRQICCHPHLVDLKSAKAVNESAKLDALIEMLREANHEGRRVLVFSSFKTMLDLIGERLAGEGIKYLSLTGQTTHRTEVIDLFQTGTIPVFLLTLKAGGVGLNLTAADTVIHYDPWWNPAAENQATDRAHRIGQTKPVLVYRLIAQSTIEDKIQELKQRKSALADAILEGGTVAPMSWTEADVAELFAPMK